MKSAEKRGQSFTRSEAADFFIAKAEREIANGEKRAKELQAKPNKSPSVLHNIEYETKAIERNRRRITMFREAKAAPQSGATGR